MSPRLTQSFLASRRTGKRRAGRTFPIVGQLQKTSFPCTPLKTNPRITETFLTLLAYRARGGERSPLVSGRTLTSDGPKPGSFANPVEQPPLLGERTHLMLVRDRARQLTAAPIFNGL